MFKSFLKRRPAPELDWYKAADPADRREYDAFGPWIWEVRDEAGMPPRFRPAYPRVRDARFLLKVPVEAERRNLRPGMDLYRAVLAVSEHGATLLTLEADGFAERHLEWPEIVALRCYQNLLLSRLILLLADGGELTLAYNTVSKELMERVAGFIRERLCAASGPAPQPEPASAELDDHFFRALYREVQRWGAPAAPLFYDRPGRPCRNAKGRRRISNGTLVLDAGRDLVVVDRTQPMRSRWHAEYAYQRTFIPYRRIRSFALTHSPLWHEQELHTLTLDLAGRHEEVPCLSVPERVAEALGQHGIPAAAQPA